MTTLPVITSVVSDSVRHSDARATHALAPIFDAEPVPEYISPDHASSIYRARSGTGGREQALSMRASRARMPEADAASTGFAAQRIAQEVLSAGLYFENFRPAVTAYAAADTNFVHVRRPPESSFVIWA